MKARRVGGLDPAESLRPNAVRIVRTRLGELSDLAEAALAPEATAAQHDARIAAKRLRYVLELVGPCLSEGADEARRAAKRLQSVLGDLHDCDLMLPVVEDVPSLAAALRARRARLHAEFTELWHASEPTFRSLNC